MITHAFTCTGPYAVLVMLGIKRTENRGTRPGAERGRCAVSCSKSFCKEEYGEFVRWAARALGEEDFAQLPSWGDVKDWPGKVVGCCDYRVREAEDGALGDRPLPWDEGLPGAGPCGGGAGIWYTSGSNLKAEDDGEGIAGEEAEGRAEEGGEAGGGEDLPG